jgi:soluble lytic murein transglycosylase-like protein
MADEITPTEQEPIFTEQFEVRVDTTSFEQGLRELARLYQEWQDGLGENANNVIGAGLAIGLKQVDAQAEASTQSITRSLTKLAEAVSQISLAMQEDLSSALDKVAEKTATTVETTAEGVKAAAESVDSILAADRQFVESAPKPRKRKAPTTLAVGDEKEETPDQRQRREALEENPDIAAALEKPEQRTKQQDEARANVTEQEQIKDEAYRKEVSRIEKIRAELEANRLKAITGFEEQGEAVSRLGQQLEEARARFAALPVPQIVPELQPGQQVDRNPANDHRVFRPEDHEAPAPSGIVTAPDRHTESDVAALKEYADLFDHIKELEGQINDLNKRRLSTQADQVALDKEDLALKEKLAFAMDQIAIASLKSNPTAQLEKTEEILARVKAQADALRNSPAFSNDPANNQERAVRNEIDTQLNILAGRQKTLEATKNSAQAKLDSEANREIERSNKLADTTAKNNLRDIQGLDALRQKRAEISAQYDEVQTRLEGKTSSGLDTAALKIFNADTEKAAKLQSNLQLVDAKISSLEKFAAESESLLSKSSEAERRRQLNTLPTDARVSAATQRAQDTGAKLTEAENNLSANPTDIEARRQFAEAFKLNSNAVQDLAKSLVALRRETDAELSAQETLGRALSNYNAAAERRNLLDGDATTLATRLAEAQRQLAEAQQRTAEVKAKADAAVGSTSAADQLSLADTLKQASSDEAKAEKVVVDLQKQAVDLDKERAAQQERIAALEERIANLKARATVSNAQTRDERLQALQDEVSRLSGERTSNTNEVNRLSSPPPTEGTDDREARLKRIADLLEKNKRLTADIDRNNSALNRARDLTQNISLEEKMNAELTRQSDLVSQLNIAREKLANAGKVSKDSQIDLLEKQVAEFTERVKRAQDEVNRLAKLQPGKGSGLSEDGLRSAQAYSDALKKLAVDTERLARTQTQLDSAQQGFFGRLRAGFDDFGAEMGEALVTAVKFSTAYKLVFVGIEAVVQTLAAPFKALREGVTYLADLQDKTADLSAVIAQNVQYSKDQGENFVIAQRIGTQAMQALMDKAIEARVPVENLTKTFKALLEAKTIGLVGNMNDLINLATQMQGVIEHLAPKGQFGGADFEKSISDLFQHRATADNLFIKTVFDGDVTKWADIVKSAERTHDLVTQLAPTLRPFLDATDRAKLNFNVLKEQLLLIIQRIEGIGATPLFEYLIQGLQDVNRWLLENGQTVSNIISMFGSLVTSALQLAGVLVQTAEKLGGISTAAEGVGAAIYPIVAIFTSLASALDMAVTGARELWAALHVLGHDPDQEIQQLDNSRKNRQAERDQVADDAYRASRDPNFRPGDHQSPAERQIQQQIDQLKIQQAQQAQGIGAPAPQVGQQIANLENLQTFLASRRGFEPASSNTGPARTPEQILPNAAPEIKQALLDAAKQFGVNASLAFSVAKQESGGQQFTKLGDVVTSRSGAQGVMQLMPATAQRFNVDATDTRQNILGGVEYISRLLQKYDGNVTLALMAYNWGEGNVDAFRKTGKGLPTTNHPEGSPVPQETSDYVKKITASVGTTTTASITKGPANLLTPAQPNGDSIDRDVVKKAESEYQTAKSDYELKVEDIKEKAEESRRAIEAFAQEGVLSHQEASERIARVTAEQLEKFNTLSNGIIAKANETRDKIASDRSRDPALVKPDVDRAQAEVTNLSRRVNAQRAQITRSTESPDKAAVNERRDLQKEAYEEEYALQKQSIDAQRALLNEAAEEGRLTKVQQFDQQRALDTQEHAALVTRLTQEANLVKQQYGANTVNYQKAIDARDRAEQDWSQKLVLYGEQRRQVAYQQMLDQQRDADALRQGRINTAQAQQAVRSEANPVKGVFDSDDEKIFDLQRSDLEIRTQQKEAELSHALADSRGQETQKTAELRVELERLHEARLQLLRDEIDQRTAGAVAPQAVTQQVFREDSARLQQSKSQTESAVADKQKQLGSVNRDISSTEDPVVKVLLQKQADDLAEQLQTLTLSLNRITQSISDSAAAADESKEGFKKVGQELLKDVLGPDFLKRWEDAQGAVAKFGEAVTSLPSIVGAVKQEFGTFKQGEASGGAAGGVGALLSQGPLSDALSLIPVVGPFVKAIGVGISLIADAFRSNARRIAKEVEEQFDQTTKNISSGILGIGAGISQVGGEMDEAITKLTNLHNNQGLLHSFGFDNGAIDELNRILPPMVEEMEQLLRQQAQVFSEFNQQLKNLQLQSDTLSQINSQWQSINAQVATYLDAGGDAAKANQMIQLGLQQIVRESGAELTQGYDQAVQDAIRLNDLALQRYNMQQQFKNQSFDLINADSIERMQAGTVTRGQQLQQLKAQYQQQLDDLNSQISLESKKVAAERQIFDIAQSISDLHRQDESLQLASLQLQLQKYKDLQNAVGSITSGSATPGTGNADLSKQLGDIDQQISKYSTTLKVDQSKDDGQNQSANDAYWLMQLIKTQKVLAQQLADSAGGSLVGTGQEGGYLSAVEAAQGALGDQATYASKNTNASPWYRDVGGYIDTLTAAAASLAQSQQSVLAGGASPTIGVNPSLYQPSQLNLAGLQGLLNTGYNSSQNNNINVTVNVPNGQSTAQIGTTVADSITQALAAQQRQAIIG